LKKLYRAHRLDQVPDQQGVLVNPYLNVARRPRDTPSELHELADAWFEQEFGLRYRSRALFCFGNRPRAANFCDDNHVLIAIEPLGPYSFSYSPNCVDMYEHFKRIGAKPWQQEKVWPQLHSLHYQLGKDSWDTAVDSGCEIMVYAQQFKYLRVSS
jgi:hypothetical protein